MQFRRLLLDLVHRIKVSKAAQATRRIGRQARQLRWQIEALGHRRLLTASLSGARDYTTIFEGSNFDTDASVHPDMNDFGVTAFQTEPTYGKRTVQVADGVSTKSLTTFVEGSYDEDINAINNRANVVHVHDGGNASSFLTIYNAKSGDRLRYLDTTGQFDRFYTAAINDNDVVAFTAHTDTGKNGLYFLRNGTVQTVFEREYGTFSKRLTINNREQIGFQWGDGLFLYDNGKVQLVAGNYDVPTLYYYLPFGREGSVEGEGITFTIQLTDKSARTKAISVPYVTEDRTAKAGEDYVATSGTLTFQPGENKKTITVPVIDDDVPENVDEFFFLRLGEANGDLLPYAIAKNPVGLGIITDDDLDEYPYESRPQAEIGISRITSTVAESPKPTTAEFEVWVTWDSNYPLQTVTCDVSTFEFSATANDYVATTQTLTFSPDAQGSSQARSFLVTITNDATYELSESFIVAITSATNAYSRSYYFTDFNSIETGTISNDDPGVFLNDYLPIDFSLNNAGAIALAARYEVEFDDDANERNAVLVWKNGTTQLVEQSNATYKSFGSTDDYAYIFIGSHLYATGRGISINDSGDLAFIASTFEQSMPNTRYAYTPYTIVRRLNGSNRDEVMAERSVVFRGYHFDAFEPVVDINNTGDVMFFVTSSTKVGDPSQYHGYYGIFTTAKPIHRPILVVPGIVGTFAKDYASNAAFKEWITTRGAHPDKMVLDPVGGTYDDLMQTLVNYGYEKNVDLFSVTYDWRVLPGPEDLVNDGRISRTLAQLTDAKFEYGMDYLGYFLNAAASSWKLNHPNLLPLNDVDVIAHSTGGLVTRAYVQSNLFRAPRDPQRPNGEVLPGIKEFIMLGVPNQGSFKAWNPLHDDWSDDQAYVKYFSIIIRTAFKQMLSGKPIQGPDPSDTLTASMFQINTATGIGYDTVKFIRAYCPTIRTLLSTSLDSTPGENLVNAFLRDINSAAGVSLLVDSVHVTALAGTNVKTAVGITPAKHYAIPFYETYGASTSYGTHEGFYKLVSGATAGDGTVPASSVTGIFSNFQSKVTIKLLGGVDHGELNYDIDPQREILTALRLFAAGDDTDNISTGEHNGLLSAILVKNSIVFSFDPVEGWFQDAQGRRLGYTSASGGLAELPDSIWIGGADGFGFASLAASSKDSIRLFGLGQSYDVGFLTQMTDGRVTSRVFRGTLGVGQSVTIPVVYTTTISPTDSIIGRAPTGQWYAASNVNGTDKLVTRLVASTGTAAYLNEVKMDVNRDGYDDLVGRDSAGVWRVSVNMGNGLFSAQKTFGAWSNGIKWVDVQAGDVNGDHLTDVVGRSAGTGKWYVGLNQGNKFVNQAWLTWSPSTTWIDVRVIDMTGDGKDDVIGRDAKTGQWNVGVSTGVAFANSVWGKWLTTVAWVDVRIADVDGDRRGDIVARNSGNGNVYVALSRGASLAPSTVWTTWSTNTTWTNVKLIDMNGDGKLDLVGRGYGTAWFVYVNSSNKFNFKLWGSWPSGAYVDVVYGDFNGDGYVDVAGRKSGGWIVLRNSGTAFTPAKEWGTWSTSIVWKRVQTARI